jgi:hypothetical protein
MWNETDNTLAGKELCVGLLVCNVRRQWRCPLVRVVADENVHHQVQVFSVAFGQMNTREDLNGVY